MKNDRLFGLLYLLMERETMTAPELAEHLEVSVRTVYRDVESLSMAGIPVYTTVGKGGGISLLPGFTFDKSLLTDAEQDQILFALQSVRVAGQQVEPLLKKLGGVFRKPDQDWISVDFSRWGYHESDTERFDLIKQAILEHRVLTLTYWSAGGSSVRKVEPVRLVFRSKNWYLQAYCRKAGDFRVFKFSRIQTADLTEEVFSLRSQKVPELEREVPPDISPPALELVFAPEAAYRVYDEFDHQSIRTGQDGSLKVSVRWPVDGWVYGYLISFGDQLRIESPAWFRDSMKDYVKKIYEHYKT